MPEVLYTDERKSEIEEQAKYILDKIRPYLIADGGDVEFVRIEGDTLYIRLLDECAGCGISDITIKFGIEAAISEEIEELNHVVDVSGVENG